MSYTKRTYIFSSGDAYSANHAAEFEKRQSQSQNQNQGQDGQEVNNNDDERSHFDKKEGIEKKKAIGKKFDNYNTDNHGFSLHEIPRARRIKQSWWTTPISCIKCFIACLTVVRKADVVICNGPGTAVMVVAACWVFKVSSRNISPPLSPFFSLQATRARQDIHISIYTSRYIHVYPDIARKKRKMERKTT